VLPHDNDLEECDIQETIEMVINKTKVNISNKKHLTQFFFAG
jgi:hypothetical protein